MSSEIALYYPYIHFQNDVWLKQAALYWDKVSRIVPYGYANKLHDSNVVKQLKDADDVVVDRQPSAQIVQSVSNELLQVINDYGDTLNTYLSPDALLDGNTDSLSYLYHTKMDDQLVYTLQNAGLGTYRTLAGDADGEWLGVHPKIGHAYMTALASSMGRRGALSVVSDNPHFGVAGCGFPVRQLFANLIEADDAKLDEAPGEQAKNILGVAAMARVLPKNIEAIPIEKIIKFRQESLLERAGYREAIESVTVDLERVVEPEDLQNHLQVRGKQINAAVEKLEGKMNKLLGSTVLSAVGVSKDLPQLVSTGLGYIGLTTANPMVAVAGFAFNAYKAVRDKRQEYADLREQPYSYLVSMKESLGTTGYLEQLRTGARKLLLD